MPLPPTFIGLGAPKAATTWLFECLREHPSIFIPEAKEIGFFDFLDDIEDRLQEYFAHFEGSEASSARGEIFVMYLSSPRAPERIKRHLPNAKLFVSLRNPVEQVYSHYWHLKRQNFHRWGEGSHALPKSFASALDEFPNELVAPARYAENLKRWLSLFKREQLHIMLYEDIKADPLREIQALYHFLGVSDSYVPISLNRKDANVRAGVSPKSKAHDALHAKIYSGLNRFVYQKVKQVIGTSAADRIKNKLRVRQVMQSVFYQQGYPPLTDKDKMKIQDLLGADVAELESMLDRDLSQWRS